MILPSLYHILLLYIEHPPAGLTMQNVSKCTCKQQECNMHRNVKRVRMHIVCQHSARSADTQR